MYLMLDRVLEVEVEFETYLSLFSYAEATSFLHHASTIPSIATMDDGSAMIQTGIFEDLQKKIDDDSAIKDVRIGIENKREKGFRC